MKDPVSLISALFGDVETPSPYLRAENKDTVPKNGGSLRLVVFVCVCWSSQRSMVLLFLFSVHPCGRVYLVFSV